MKTWTGPFYTKRSQKIPSTSEENKFYGPFTICIVAIIHEIAKLIYKNPLLEN
jgi:hypothetical protein